MNTLKDFFPAGATYAPLAKATEVDMSEWESDIKRMAASGLNTFRIFIAWDRIEQKEGIRDFSKADHAFKLAEKYGMKVIINMGGTFANIQAIYPPRWLYTKKKCTLLKEKPLDQPIVNTPRIKLCYDDPVYQKYATKFIADAVKRYKKSPALLAYSAWNEPRVSLCYCEHTLALFREFLKEKYGTLEALIKAWSTEFPLHYDSWDEIYPQENVGFEHGGYVPFMDWRKFSWKNRSDKFRLVAETIRKADSEHPVLSHLCGPYDADIFDSEDIPGTSVYTYFKEGRERYNISASTHMRTLSWNITCMNLGNRKERSLAPENFWVLETEAGPVSWVHNLMPRSYSARRMNARDMIFTGSGAGCILRWLYRSRVTDAQAGEFNLVGWDGSETERLREFGALSKFLNSHSELFASNRVFRSGLAVLAFDEYQKHLMDAEEMHHKYSMSPENIFTCLKHAGYHPELLNDRLILEENALKNCKALVIPFRPYLSSKMASVLDKFVKNGGLLITESPFAIKNEDAIHWEITPGAGLTKVFGTQVYDLEKLFEENCGKVKGFDFKAVMRTSTCKVESVFCDGSPALISNSYGKGKAVLFSSLVSMGYEYESGEALRKLLTSYLSEAGLKPTFKLDCKNKKQVTETGVFIRSLGEKRILLTVVSMSESDNFCKLKLDKLASIVSVGSSDEKTVDKISSSGLELKLKPYGWSSFVATLK